MVINANIPIFPQNGYTLERDFFQGYFHYGKDRYEFLPDDVLGPAVRLFKRAVRHTRVSQPWWLIALKIITLATIILPLIAIFMMSEQKTGRKHFDFIINPMPWVPPAIAPQGNRPAPPKPAPDPIGPPIHPKIMDANAPEVRQVQENYKKLLEEVERIGNLDPSLDPRGFKKRLERFRDVEIAIVKGGTPRQILNRLNAEAGLGWWIHEEQIEHMGMKLTQEQKEAKYLDVIVSEIKVLTLVINRRLQEVMEACKNILPCMQATMEAIQNLELDLIKDDFIPNLEIKQDPIARANALLVVFLRVQASSFLKGKNKKDTPEERQKCVEDPNFVKRTFVLNDNRECPTLMKWLLDNKYVGPMGEKVTHNGQKVPFTQDIATKAFQDLYDVLDLDG
jgi:hypothetical protein